MRYSYGGTRTRRQRFFPRQLRGRPSRAFAARIDGSTGVVARGRVSVLPGLCASTRAPCCPKTRVRCCLASRCQRGLRQRRGARGGQREIAGVRVHRTGHAFGPGSTPVFNARNSSVATVCEPLALGQLAGDGDAPDGAAPVRMSMSSQPAPSKVRPVEQHDIAMRARSRSGPNAGGQVAMETLGCMHSHTGASPRRAAVSDSDSRQRRVAQTALMQHPLPPERQPGRRFDDTAHRWKNARRRQLGTQAFLGFGQRPSFDALRHGAVPVRAGHAARLVRGIERDGQPAMDQAAGDHQASPRSRLRSSSCQGSVSKICSRAKVAGRFQAVSSLPADHASAQGNSVRCGQGDEVEEVFVERQRGIAAPAPHAPQMCVARSLPAGVRRGGPAGSSAASGPAACHRLARDPALASTRQRSTHSLG